MISAIALDPYRLALRRPWHSARGCLRARLGWLVRIEVDGLAGYGDCAPLPDAGTEDGATAWAWLCAWRERSIGRPLDLALGDLARDDPLAPAAAFAAECALADLSAQAAGVPLARWLNPGLAPPVPLSVPVNAALGPLGLVMPADIEASAAEGYRVFKVKLGLDGVDAELNRLVELAPYLPNGGRFRLDANGAWTLAEARRAVAGLSRLPVEALEEPLRDPAPESLRELQGEAAFSLALDETLASAAARVDPAEIPVRRLVVKPAVLGGLQRTLAFARAAAAADIEVVVTSLIESAAGLWPTVHLAAAIASPIPQGLATADWLAKDLGEAPRPRAGRIHVSPVNGGGFRPQRGSKHRLSRC